MKYFTAKNQQNPRNPRAIKHKPHTDCTDSTDNSISQIIREILYRKKSAKSVKSVSDKLTAAKNLWKSVENHTSHPWKSVLNFTATAEIINLWKSVENHTSHPWKSVLNSPTRRRKYICIYAKIFLILHSVNTWLPFRVGILIVSIINVTNIAKQQCECQPLRWIAIPPHGTATHNPLDYSH